MSVPDDAIYNTAINNIQFIKKQEWLFTSSALTVYGALAAAPKYLAFNRLMAVFLCLAIIASWIFNVFIFYGMKKSLDLSRNEIDRMLNQHSERGYFDKCGLFVCLFAILFAGSIVSGYAISLSSGLFGIASYSCF